jgi:hypothetical protein
MKVFFNLTPAKKNPSQHSQDISSKTTKCLQETDIFSHRMHLTAGPASFASQCEAWSIFYYIIYVHADLSVAQATAFSHFSSNDIALSLSVTTLKEHLHQIWLMRTSHKQE